MAISAEARSERHRVPALEPALAITDNGLVLGGTVLAPVGRSEDGRPKLAIDGAEERILALLAAVYGRAVRLGILGNIRRASTYWRQGEPALAAIELALAGLPRLADAEGVRRRLGLTEKLLAAGLPASELMKACGLDLDQFDVLKAGYNPDQPRVPAGNPTGGQWTDSDGPAEGASTRPLAPHGNPPSAVAATLIEYKVRKEPPSDVRVVIPPDGTPVVGGDPPSLLIAPRHADYRQVYAAGQAIAPLSPFDQILHIRSALHQGGAYDFQRDRIRQETQPAYANASNYAVGVYLAGAGYSLSTARRMAEAYALFNSSNYGDKNQIGWIEQGWRDGATGRWK